MTATRRLRNARIKKRATKDVAIEKDVNRPSFSMRCSQSRSIFQNPWIGYCKLSDRLYIEIHHRRIDQRSTDTRRCKRKNRMKTAILTGDTFMVKARIMGAGWKWNAELKGFTKSVDADATESGVVMDVRSIGGVRNRPKKLVVTFA